MSDSSNKPFVILGSSPGKASTAGAPERRSTPRYPFTAAAEVVEINSQARVAGRCADLGQGGCFIDTLSPLTVGTAVRVRIEKNAQIFEAAAIVSYAQLSMGMGLAFAEIKPEHAAVLRTWIAELSGESAAPQEPFTTQTGEAAKAAAEITDTEVLQHVIDELIRLLVRRKVMTEKEAAMLLRQFSR